MANIKNAVKLGVFTLAIMNVTAVVSLRGLPAEAVYGMSSAFYYLFAAIVFLIPTSLVAAELAAMFQDRPACAPAREALSACIHTPPPDTVLRQSICHILQAKLY